MEKPYIVIISSSVRNNRSSHRVALFLEKFLRSRKLATPEILDLQKYKFPLFEERLSKMVYPSPGVLDFANRIRVADGVIIVTPEYNGGYPAALKNVIDLLYDEWFRKPVAITAVSDGVFGGTQVLVALQWVLWKIRARVVTAMLPIRSVNDTFDSSGELSRGIVADMTYRVQGFIDELLWTIGIPVEADPKPTA